MPQFLVILLLAPILIDIWLTVLVAQALSIPTWAIFLVPSLLGLVLLSIERQRVREQFSALRQLQGSPLGLLGSARRGIAAVLLLIPGLGSDLIALFLLLMGLFRRQATVQTQTFVFGARYPEPEPTSPPSGAGKSGEPHIIEGDFRRD